MSREAGLLLTTLGLQGSRVVRGLTGCLTCLKAAKSICSSITQGGANNFTLNSLSSPALSGAPSTQKELLRPFQRIQFNNK